MKYLLSIVILFNIIFANNYLPKTGYCIQALSATKKNYLIKKFNSSYKYARIEKINNYYVIRFFQEKQPKELKKYLKKIKKEYSSAFIRKCDYIPERIVYPIIYKNRQKIKKQKTVHKYTDIHKDVNCTINDIKQLIAKGEYQKANEMISKIPKIDEREEIFYYKGLIALKLKNYKKACNIFSVLSNLFNEPKYKYLNKTACNKFNYQNIKKNIKNNPALALDLINKLEKNSYFDNELKKYKVMIYLNLAKYEKAYELLKNMNIQNEDIKNLYLADLVELGKFDEIFKIKDYKKCEFYKNNKYFFKALENYKNKNYNKAYFYASIYYRHHQNDKAVNLLLAKIMLKNKQIDNAFMYLFNIDNYNISDLKLFRNLFYYEYDYINAFNIVNELKIRGYSDEMNDEVSKEYYLLKAYKEMKNNNLNDALNYIKEADNIKSDIDTLSMLGEIYEKMGNYDLAYKNYHDALIFEPKNIYINKKILDILFKSNKLADAKDFALNSNLQEVKNYYFILLAKNYLKNKNFVMANKMLAYVDGDYSNDYYNLKGVVCFNLHNYICAIKNLEKTFDSKDKIYYLIQAYNAINEKDKAKKLLAYLKKYYKINNDKLIGLYIELGEYEK